MALMCENCGATLGRSERFCGSCGTRTATAEHGQGTLVREPAIGTDAPVSTAPSAQALRPPAPGMIPPPGNLNPLPYAPVMTSNQTVNVSTNIAFLQSNTGPNLFVRAIWFIFIGWWLGGLAILLAYLLFLPIITIPAGIGILNRLPQIMTLRPRTMSFKMTQSGDALVIEESTLPQRPWWQRLIYLVFAGWWLGAIWLSVAWLLGVLSIITLGLTLPIAFWMFNRTGAVISLYRT